MKWTPSQQTAIDARDGSLLVSAAAGSGKTAVLVERVMRRIEDRENGCNIDELLIVTFTNAAAAQMREKIETALEKRISKDPKNRHLLRQRALMPFAKISTIDALCSNIARENFQKLDIEPDFKIDDDLSLREMKREAVDMAVEEMYKEGSEAFLELSELFFRGRNDDFLAETIMKTDDVACSYTDPEKWIKSLYAFYENKDSGCGVWERIALKHIKKMVAYCRVFAENAMQVIKTDEDVIDKYMPVLTEDMSILDSIDEILDSKYDWDGKGILISSHTQSYSRSPSVRNCDSYEKFFALNTRKHNKDRLKKIESILSVSEDRLREDLEYTYPIAKAFSKALLKYRNNLFDIKKQANSYSFSDISAFALSCLCDENGRKTQLAKDMSEKFTEILVDEFQDINDMQNMLFKLLSKQKNNLFFVGDSKQSIYKFRQARPKIFINMKQSRPVYKDSNYPAVVNLDMNFRSRKGVTEWINFLFEGIMTDPENCEIIYDETETLKPGAVYPEKDCPDTEIHILQRSKISGNSDIEAQAHYLARYIKEQLESGLRVTEDGEERKARYGDFCILLRSDNGKIRTVAEILEKNGIPAQSGTKGNFFEEHEVQTVLSLLQVIDNPLRDIPLLAVMMSPIYGFTPDDMAKLRINDRKGSLYECVKKMSKEDGRYESLIRDLEIMRLKSVSLPVGELVRRLMEDTGYLAIAGAMPAGDGRRANLLQLQRLADSYDSTGGGGLSGFLRFTERIDERGDKVEKASVPTTSKNAVKIMTIHKSKGLEFPVCILADCSTNFNTREYSGNYLLSEDKGLTTVRRDSKRLTQHDTLPKQLITQTGKLSDLNEEMRILYVALTRAKERLVTLSTVSNAGKKLSELSVGLTYDGKVTDVSELTSYTEMILSAAVCHPDAHLFRVEAGISSCAVRESKGRIKAVIENETVSEDVKETDDRSEFTVDETVIAKLDRRLRYTYPYDGLREVIAKHSASQISDGGINREFFASSRPAFLNEGGLTPAQRGTALHKFMQYSDYVNASKDAIKEADRLVNAGLLSDAERECLDFKKIKAFFESDTGRRVYRAEKLYREYRFTVERQAKSLYKNLPENLSGETVIIQGMVDCAFVENGKLHIVDYKTDKASKEEIAERYIMQIKIYADAMRECTETEIGDLILYSFFNEKEIRLN